MTEFDHRWPMNPRVYRACSVIQLVSVVIGLLAIGLLMWLGQDHSLTSVLEVVLVLGIAGAFAGTAVRRLFYAPSGG